METILAHEMRDLSDAIGGDVGSLDVLLSRAASEIRELKQDREDLISALADLSFNCYGFFSTHAPSIEVYNTTFAALDRIRKRLVRPGLTTPEELYRDLLYKLGCNGHAGAIAEIERLREQNGLVHGSRPKDDL